MADTKASAKTRSELKKVVLEVQVNAMKPGIPAPQRLAMKNRAQELRDQLIELEAARFNAATAKYKTALASVNKAIASLRSTVKKFDDAIKVLDSANKTFKSIHNLLNTATKFIGLP